MELLLLDSTTFQHIRDKLNNLYQNNNVKFIDLLFQNIIKIQPLMLKYIIETFNISFDKYFAKNTSVPQFLYSLNDIHLYTMYLLLINNFPNIIAGNIFFYYSIDKDITHILDVCYTLNININVINDDIEETVLHYAIHEANRKLVLSLLSHGADPNQVSIIGLTPLFMALNIKDYFIARDLLVYGAVPKWRYVRDYELYKMIESLEILEPVFASKLRLDLPLYQYGESVVSSNGMITSWPYYIDNLRLPIYVNVYKDTRIDAANPPTPEEQYQYILKVLEATKETLATPIVSSPRPQLPVL